MSRILMCLLTLSLFLGSCNQKTKPEETKAVEIAENKPKKEKFIKRAFYNAKYEPKAGVLHGAGQDPKGFNEYVTAVGNDKFPVIYMTYINIALGKDKVKEWGEKLEKQLDSLQKSVIPQIGLEFVGGKNTGSGLDHDVANGKYDEALDAFYNALLKIDRPTFTRIGYEFDGSWNGYSPEGYKKVFVKIAKAFKDKSIKTATVWCSAGGSAGFLSKEKLMAYYPGDEYVDWWGIDIFSPQELSHPNLKNFYKDADAHQKPIMIGESTPRHVGVKDGKTSWDTWYQPYFDGIYQNPQIKAICYINWDWLYWSNKIGFPWHDWGDARIDQNDFVLEAYKTEISEPLFIHVSE